MGCEDEVDWDIQINMNNKKSPSEYLDEIAGGYRAAQILFTANRLNIFNTLGARKMSVEEIAAATGASLRGIRILCDALCALEILSKQGDHYSNSEISTACLLLDSKESKASMFHHGARLYEKWGRLFDAVQTGTPVSEQDLDPRLDIGKSGFAKAMQDTASKSAGLLVDQIDLSGKRKLLDLGGGPGIYAIEFCRRNPNLKAWVLDNAETLKVTEENINQAGLSERIRTIPGDMFESDFGETFDFILISNVIHIYSTEMNLILIRKCYEALQPGGWLCIKDFFLDETRTKPQWAAVFTVNMLVNSEAGDCYTNEEMKRWLNESGFEGIREIEITPYSKAFLGIRK